MRAVSRPGHLKSKGICFVVKHLVPPFVSRISNVVNSTRLEVTNVLTQNEFSLTAPVPVSTNQLITICLPDWWLLCNTVWSLNRADHAFPANWMSIAAQDAAFPTISCARLYDRRTYIYGRSLNVFRHRVPLCYTLWCSNIQIPFIIYLPLGFINKRNHISLVVSHLGLWRVHAHSRMCVFLCGESNACAPQISWFPHSIHVCPWNIAMIISNTAIKLANYQRSHRMNCDEKEKGNQFADFMQNTLHKVAQAIFDIVETTSQCRHTDRLECANVWSQYVINVYAIHLLMRRLLET